MLKYWPSFFVEIIPDSINTYYVLCVLDGIIYIILTGSQNNSVILTAVLTGIRGAFSLTFLSPYWFSGYHWFKLGSQLQFGFKVFVNIRDILKEIFTFEYFFYICIHKYKNLLAQRRSSF